MKIVGVIICNLFKRTFMIVSIVDSFEYASASSCFEQGEDTASSAFSKSCVTAV